jgi:hypothetical protein
MDAIGALAGMLARKMVGITLALLIPSLFLINIGWNAALHLLILFSSCLGRDGNCIRRSRAVYKTLFWKS